MSDFWWGVLALPIIAGIAAVTAYVVMGGWLVLEKWAENRSREMNFDVSWDSVFYRVTPAALVLASPKMRRFRLGFGCSLYYVRGANSINKTTWQAIRNAVHDSVKDVDAAIKSGTAL